mgnify:CR=1 FL=1
MMMIILLLITLHIIALFSFAESDPFDLSGKEQQIEELVFPTIRKIETQKDIAYTYYGNED